MSSSNSSSLRKSVFLGLLALIVLLFLTQFSPSKSKLKLYWFIPDGVRAEPGLFNIYKWAEEGKLPNIKKMMEMGSYGFSRPTFPTHTPTNFATLLTGAYPEIHGVDDGPMHVEGKPLDKVAIGGFRSVAKKVPAIWTTLEEAGHKVALISVPGSTPPEINKGVVLRGRWGGWGADFHALNFETKGNLAQRIRQGRASRLFFFGPQLTTYLDGQIPEGWDNIPESFSDPFEVPLAGWGLTVYALVYDSTNDSRINYDKVAFSVDKKEIISNIEEGEWGDWNPTVLKWKAEDNQLDVNSNFRVTVIKLEEDGFFRIRIYYDNLNEHNAVPDNASDLLHEHAGPMMDFVDNFPPQLIYYDEDKKTFLEEANKTFNWHKKAVSGLIKSFSPNIVIHDIYTPNQMLTSRWWMGYVDPNSTRYSDISDSERNKLWEEVKEMYIKLDEIVGEILKQGDKNTYIVFSSDHGATPLDRWVHLNNLFAQKGWLKFSINPDTGEPIIDWVNSKVIYLKMAHVYINPAGLDGDYHRASGSEYEALREEVKETLINLQDEQGTNPVVDVVKWENAQKFLQLDPKRVGDLIIANTPGYGWNEEMTSDLRIFSEPLKTGYKQAIKAEEVTAMWTPFIIVGPGIKESNFLGDIPIEMVDQYPTIMTALKEEVPNFVQGKVLDIFK